MNPPGSLRFMQMAAKASDFAKRRRSWTYLFLAAISLVVVPQGSAQLPQVIELRSNWKLVSARDLNDSGSAISQSSYPTTQWYPIHRMPATVLEVLEEDGVYPNLYYGMNLLTGVPQDIYKQDWWYRTSFRAPSARKVVWIDFPGINYRADIWVNGTLIAERSQAVGMYVDHRYNITSVIRRGTTNVVAVKVTPEQLIRNLDGVELADSWLNWINWKYLGYKGPLNTNLLSSSKVVARYVEPHGAAGPQAVNTHVTITAGSTTSITLAAAVSAGGTSVRSGTVAFERNGTFLGQSAVNAEGLATLEIPADQMFAGSSFVADRNAGIWKPVSIYVTGAVKLSNPLVETKLSLAGTTAAELTVYAEATNGSSSSVNGTLHAAITRFGRPSIHMVQQVSLAPGEIRQVKFSPNDFPQLTVQHPDLWWPYTIGKPSLYDLHITFSEDDYVSDTTSLRFGIRQIEQSRDDDEQFRDLGTGGNFYLKVNGRNFLIRGAAYTPDLLYHYDPKREATEIGYAKDMGLNMLRWESKISSQHMLQLADEAGLPVMYGWMCCDQWESWSQWNDEDQRVARESLKSQILMLRSHPSVFIWANGSDGRPPDPLRQDYRDILTALHWQNAVVDTVSSFAKDAGGARLWDGIHMEGPYTWRPPSYWFSGRYAPSRGSCAEQGDTAIIPPYETLKKFLPPDKLWPINEYWFFHAGASSGVNELASTRLAVDERLGPSAGVEEFAKKAQLAVYENTRAQFENFAANGWANHKMTIYWMLNTSWPSFYGGLYDYYLRPGGGYYGAKKGLRPVSIVFDYYAAGDHTSSAIRVTNQTTSDLHELSGRIRVYDLFGHTKYDARISGIHLGPQSVVLVHKMPVVPNLTETYFVRCELFGSSGSKVMENVYWQSTTLDDMGSPSNDQVHGLNQATWAKLGALNAMPKVQLQIDGTTYVADGQRHVRITLHNPSDHVAFFERVEVTAAPNGDELLPVLYDDNYVTVFPKETVHLQAMVKSNLDNGRHLWIRLNGYNTLKEVTKIRQ